jgi:hypothetical protein
LTLGLVLGFGYLAKAPLFPVAFLIFVAAAARRHWDRRQFLRFSAMVLVFALVSTPFIVVLSKNQGRLTLGDSARLNWAWWINGACPNYVFWER